MKFLLVVIIFAVVTYLAIRWMQDRGLGGPAAKRLPSRPKPPSRPVAPDDDESFLRDLERKRRKQARDAKPPEPPAPDTGGPES
ncbi:MAG: hypothetical protein NTX33_10660 [Propionibacteriales bacterium]|nr:hypothetical protein [Propionibacteriales bacterium]